MAQTTAEDGASTLAAAALGAKVVDSIMGDLSGEGHDDALLVIDPVHDAGANGRRKLEVVLMRRGPGGRLSKAATNARLLACGPGAKAGDWLRAQTGSFTIVDAGTGPCATRAEYRFDYDHHTQDWRAVHVLRRIVDPVTGREQRQEWTERDLKRVSFAQFDPARLPIFEEKNK